MAEQENKSQWGWNWVSINRYGWLKYLASYIIYVYCVICLFVLFGLQPATMDAILATIVTGRQAQVWLNVDVIKNYLITLLNNWIYKNPSMVALDYIRARLPTPWVAWINQIHATGRVGSFATMVVVFVVCLCVLCVLSCDSWLLSQVICM